MNYIHQSPLHLAIEKGNIKIINVFLSSEKTDTNFGIILKKQIHFFYKIPKNIYVFNKIWRKIFKWSFKTIEI